MVNISSHFKNPPEPDVVASTEPIVELSSFCLHQSKQIIISACAQYGIA